MTPEQQLAAVIDAQVKGGCHTWYRRLTSYLERDSSKPLEVSERVDGPHVGNFQFLKGKDELHDYEDSVGVIQILLDPQGLRAAYPEGTAQQLLEDEFAKYANRDYPFWRIAAYLILDAWLSGGAAAAIQTAYDLLP